MDRDEYYMKRALSLAKKGLGKTNPNPLVGALLVKDGKILAKGYHRRAGLPHAEVEALKKVGKKARGSTLYVNLEPCDHFGKTPPCTEMIIRDGIKRVVIGMHDPNPINNGKGIKRLQKAGLDVRCGVLEKECKILNRVFTTYITQKRPYVTIKVAQSLDGKIATPSGHSKWITNESSRRFVHMLRSQVDAISVGVNTIIKDNPRLNPRIKDPKRQPIKIILDTKLKTPKDSKILKDNPSRVIIAAAKGVSKKKVLEFQKLGVDVITLKKDNGMVDLKSLLEYLKGNDISHILVEGGGTAIASFLKDRLVDEALFFISPKIIGGKDAITSVEGRGVRLIGQAIRLRDVKLRRFNEDILIQGYIC